MSYIIYICWPKGSSKDDFAYTAGTCMNRPIEKIKMQERWQLQVEITTRLRYIADTFSIKWGLYNFVSNFTLLILADLRSERLGMLVMDPH
jgi:hypothetical protein